jgi:hypothetical protein
VETVAQAAWSRIIGRDTRFVSSGAVLACLQLLGCATRPMEQGHPDAGSDTAGSGPVSWTVPTDAGTVVYNVRFPIRPVRKLDLVFVLDTSPSMAAKQQKLAAAFPKFIDALTDPSTEALPDLRVAIITSDMGTGGVSSVGSCGPRPDGSLWGDQGKFRFINATACGVTDSSQPWLFENRNADPVQRNYAGDFASVFACLASAVGSGGCVFSQPLRALESAFYDPSNVALQRDGFIRHDAYMGIVIISDQDDCSSGSSAGVFADAAADESPRLRCTTRSSVCNGQNLTMSPPGYPTTAAFAANLASCATRTDFCGPGIDSTQPTDCNPLADYRSIADNLKQLKSDPDNQIAVAGIFGWPLNGDTTSAQLIVDEAPNTDPTDTPQTQIFDTWPICYDPNHSPTAPPGGFDPAAAAWGGTAGVRLSAFIDEFGRNGLKFSVCESDYSAAMETSGGFDDLVLHSLCIDSKLLDTDLVQPGVQASCRVWLSIPPVGSPGGPYTETAPYAECDPARSVVPCWYVIQDTTKCPVNGQLIGTVRESGETTFNEGTILNVQCQACPNGVADPATIPGCDYNL